MASAAVTGILHGNTITLDGPVPPLEGQRVRIVIALMDEEIELAPGEQSNAWKEWITGGPQGPIEDDGEPEFP
jgi:hypothetical protein